MIRIRTTNSEAERQAIYRLRYECLYKEGADPAYANHESGEYRDEYDTDAAHIIVAEDEAAGELVATLRLLLRKESDFPYEWCYDYALLAEQTGLPREKLVAICALIDRGAVRPAYRGKDLYWAMEKYAGVIMRDRGAAILLGTWIESKLSLARAHVVKAGWELPDRDYRNSKGRPYYFGYKILSDQ